VIDDALARSGRAHRALESLHSLVYFVPEATDEYVTIGLRPGSMPYFASRSAAMGAVGPGAVAATFYNFNPAMVAKHLPRAWTLATPEAVLAARLRVADLTYRRMLGDGLADLSLAELAGLAREACTALAGEGRALFAAHADLPWPDEPHLVLWHAATLLREYRGDGHCAVLLDNGVSGLDALLTHTATGRGFPTAAARVTRGWSEEQWSAGSERLLAAGLLDAAGLSPAGAALRERIEAETDRLDTAAWVHLGADRTDRLIELGKYFSKIVINAGAFAPLTGIGR
jgi:hypothetical protein